MYPDQPQTVSPRPVTIPPGGPATPPHAKKESFGSIASTVAILLIAPLIAVLLTAFVFQSYQVEGPSMSNTLHNNDRLIVWKLPKTWSKITRHAYIPGRGDIIVFTEPRLNELGKDPGKQLIKRVVGLPGERVVVKNNVVTVYNGDHPGGFQPDSQSSHTYADTTTSGNIDVVVAENQVFVLGDNRPNSLDSRAFGPVDSNDIVGKLTVRVLPLNNIDRF